MPHPRPQFRPALERLEDRRVMDVSVSAGAIYIVGTPGNDNAYVESRPPWNNLYGGQYEVWFNGQRYFLQNVWRREVHFLGYAGDDHLEAVLDAGIDRVFAAGMDGNDYLAAYAKTAVLDGGAGNDSLAANLGAYNEPFGLLPGFGDDTLLGGIGDDELYGWHGNDVLDGGPGDDILLGGVGDDTLYGRAGNDKLDGGIGHDFLDGGAGNDSLFGRAGRDRLDGGADDDYLDGGADRSPDDLIGGTGNDVFVQYYRWNAWAGDLEAEDYTLDLGIDAGDAEDGRFIH
jgi:Ca2+-binding RTX toxin-like protein